MKKKFFNLKTFALPALVIVGIIFSSMSTVGAYTENDIFNFVATTDYIKVSMPDSVKADNVYRASNILAAVRACLKSF